MVPARTSPVSESHRNVAALERLLDAAIVLTAADMGHCQLADPRTGALRTVAGRGFKAEFLEFFNTPACEGGASACAVAFRQARRIVVPDVTESPNLTHAAKLVLRAAGVRAVQATPIFRRPGGRVMGMISTHWRSVTTPESDQLARLDLAISRVADDIAKEQEAIKVASIAGDLMARFGADAAGVAANRAQCNFDRGAAAFWSEVERALTAGCQADC